MADTVFATSYEYGYQDSFLALETYSKLVLTHTVGKRDANATQWFLEDLRDRTIGRIQLSTDARPAERRRRARMCLVPTGSIDPNGCKKLEDNAARTPRYGPSIHGSMWCART